jgi:hypothetical protein
MLKKSYPQNVLFLDHLAVENFVKTNVESFVRRKYVDFSRDIGVTQLLEANGFMRCDQELQPSCDSDSFLEEYIKLIDQLAETNQSMFWWASELATKNRYLTQLPMELKQVLLINRILKEDDFSVLVLIGVQPTVCSWCRQNHRSKELIFSGGRPRGFLGLASSSLVLRLLFIYRTLLQTIHLVGRVIYSRKVLSNKSRRQYLESESFVLVKTFVLANNIIEGKGFQDRIFGNLSGVFRKNGRNVFSLCHINRNYRQVVKKLRDHQLEHVCPYEWFLNILDVIKIASGMLIFSPRIEKVLFFDLDVTTLVRKEYERSGASVSQCALFYVGRNIACNYVLEKVVLTFENRGWENSFISGLRAEVPDLSIIGYQHAVVSPSTAGMFLGLNEIELKARPSKILTVGEEPRRMLLRYGKFLPNEIETACALQYGWLQSVEMRQEIYRRNKILLMVEGVIEVHRIIYYCVASFRKIPQYELVIRTHPELLFTDIPLRTKIDLNEEKNISLSDADTLREDLDSADICIYWGSTTAIEALSLGIPLIHFDMGTPLSYDPLLKCKALKWTISEYDSLSDTINDIYMMDESRFLDEAERAKKFVSQYFTPVTPQGIDKFLLS